MTKRRRDLIAFVTSVYVCFCIVYFTSSVITSLFSSANVSSQTLKTGGDKYTSVFVHRRILNASDAFITNDTRQEFRHDKEENCTPPAIEQFPRPLMDYTVRRNGGLLIHVFVSLYMFLGLAIVCDEYFVPSLEKMCDALDMSSDVAGATFMAAGSSAPELATAIIAVFIAKDDIGIGTVVGSAVYNIAFVIGICGLFAGRTIFLNWWPMFRDCLFYFISILALLFTMYDEVITWFEAVIFLVLYGAYIGFMTVNDKIEQWLYHFPCMDYFRRKATEQSHLVPYKPVPESVPLPVENVICDKIVNGCPDNESLPSSTADDDHEDHSPLNPPAGMFYKVLWIISLPLIFLCFISIPDCRRKKWQSWFFVTFILSCLWISVFSYLLVWMITIIGFTLHIKDTVMGLTFLAAGVSVPDAIASLIVVKEGFGDMAVSNAIGSNVFDILICLGLPWFLQTAVVTPGSTVAVRSRGLSYSTLSLLLTVVVLLISSHLNGWKLDKRYGSILLIWYAVFMIVASMYELNVFGNFTLPTCPSDF